MQGDEKQPPQKRPRTRSDSSASFNVPETEDDVSPQEILSDSRPYRNRNSSIRLRDPMSIQTTGPQTTRRNVNIPDRILTPSPDAVPARSIRGTIIKKSPPGEHQRKSPHWLLYVGVGMIAMLALWVVGSSALAWGLARYNDIRYGNPRTFQIDAVVGHGDDAAHPSHFIAINLHRHVFVIEFMAGNPAKAISYSGPYLFGQGGDLIPVTLEFRDVTGDGQPDMLIHIQDQTIVFVNDGTKFRPPNSSDHIHL
jgi:hypothetical protein